MDRFRYSLAVLLWIVYAPGLLFWFVIHPWVRWWRRLGPPPTYFILISALAGLGFLLFQARRVLLGRDLGTSWSLIGTRLVLEGVLAWLGLRYARHATHLSL